MKKSFGRQENKNSYYKRTDEFPFHLVLLYDIYLSSWGYSGTILFKMPDVFVAENHNEKKELHPEVEVGLTKGDTKNPFAAFTVHPHNLRFESQSIEEDIILLLRQHVVVMVPWVFMIALMFLIPLWFPILSRVLSIDLSAIPVGFQVVGFFVWYLITMGLAFEKFLNWYFNVYIITSERVIDIDFLSLLYKQVSEAQIAKIQDVTYTMGGLVRALFDYGDVRIQTAGELPNFEFLAVPHPDKVAKVIADLKLKDEKEGKI